MGDVLGFVHALEQVRDWSAAERDKLAALADSLADGAAGVSTHYGRTDAGDPWCVVTTANGEVLLHAARLGGRFVVHALARDVVSRGADLRAALHEAFGRDVLGDIARGEVISFASRATQVTLTVAIAAVFLDRTAEAHTGLLRYAPPPEPPQFQTERVTAVSIAVAAIAGSLAPALAETAEQRADDAGVTAKVTTAPALEPAAAQPANGAAVAADRPNKAPAPELQPREGETSQMEQLQYGPAPLLFGSNGDDQLTGGALAERVLGGDGDDWLRGGGASDGFDLLDGGAGDDWIELSGLTVAVGGHGGDSFVLHAADTDGWFGVILDFQKAEGDRLVGPDGTKVTILRATPIDDVLAELRDHPAWANAPVVAGHRLFVDIDGDGAVDGYADVADWAGPATAPHSITHPPEFVG